MSRKIKIGVVTSLFVVLGIGFYAYPKYRMIHMTQHLFDEDQIVENFRSFDQIWPTKTLEASSNPFRYQEGENINLPLSFNFNGTDYETEDFLKDSWTTGLLVIQNDQIVFENYYLGNTESTRNISWSMAKSFISALFGIAVDEGFITDLNATVETILPSLAGSGYDGVKIKDVLQMSTGVKFSEDYGDPESDINRWGRDFALGNAQDAFAATLVRELEPGTVNHYVSINTHVLGMILTKATGQSITDYMQEKLWEPMGMEYDGYWLVDGPGMEMALGGLNTTLRDYAKIGSLYLKHGNWQGKQLVSKQWVQESLTPDAPHLMPGEKELGYGYQWWIPKSEQNEFMAIGVYNQNIYINPATETVIVKLSANPFYNDKSYVPSLTEANIQLYRSIVQSLDET